MKKKVIEIKDWVKDRDTSVKEKFFPKKLTENHLKYKRYIQEKTITISTGYSGTGKTCLAIETAAELFKNGTIKQIVLTRPQVECDEEMGFLPGNAEEKMAFYIRPVMSALATHFNAIDIEHLKKNEQLLIIPLAQMRGNTFHKAFICMDECQNATYRQIEMFLTRLGFGSKAVLNGDLKQSDLVHGIRNVPFLKAIEDLTRPPIPDEIGLIFFGREDVLRPDIVQMVTDRMGQEDYNLSELIELLDPELELPSYGKLKKKK